MDAFLLSAFNEKQPTVTKRKSVTDSDQMKALMATVAGFSRKTEDIENDLEDEKDTTEVLREKCINLCAATNKSEDKIAVLQQKYISLTMKVFNCKKTWSNLEIPSDRLDAAITTKNLNEKMVK